MENQLLDDERDELQLKVLAFQKTHKRLRPFNLVIPLAYGGMVYVFFADQFGLEIVTVSLFAFFGCYLSSGIIGWLLGRTMAMFLSKDVPKKVRNPYYITIGTLIISSLYLLSMFYVVVEWYLL